MSLPLGQTAAPRPDANRQSFAAASLDRDGLLGLGAEWQELTERALEENAYFSPRYVRGLAELIAPEAKLRAIAVRQEERLVGLLPYVSERWRWAGLAEVNAVWTTKYSFASTPLIDRDCPGATIDAMVAAMADGPARSRFWLFPQLQIDGPVAAALREALAVRGLQSATLNVFERAVLKQGKSFDEHMAAHVSSKRRRELKRCRKRLQESGALEFRSFREGAGLDQAVDDFLRIERSGWKGEQGTALDCVRNGRAFASATLGGSGLHRVGRADVLTLDGMAVAVSLSIQTGRTAFTIKCAFDERFRAEGLGLLLEEDVIRDFLEGDWADCLDSATQAGHVIQSLWGDTIRIADFLFATGQNAGADLHRAIRLETARRSVREKAKQSLAYFRG